MNGSLGGHKLSREDDGYEPGEGGEGANAGDCDWWQSWTWLNLSWKRVQRWETKSHQDTAARFFGRKGERCMGSTAEEGVFPHLEGFFSWE